MIRHPGRYALPLAGLLALAGALGACSDEKKGDPNKMSQPAPAADPAKSDAMKSDAAKPDATGSNATKPAAPH